MGKWYILSHETYNELVASGFLSKVLKKVGVMGWTYVHPVFEEIDKKLSWIERHIPEFLRIITRYLRYLLLKIALWHNKKYFKDYVAIYFEF